MVSKLGSCRVDLDYLLSRDDRIERVCDAWSEAAALRMGLRLDAERVIGRSVWDFINGGATMRLYDALFHHVRTTGRRAGFAYRGDSPGAIRYMRMHLLPGPGDRVHLRSELLHEQPRPREVYFAHVDYRRHPDLLQCSLCQKLNANGRWYTVSEALEHTDLLDTLMPVEVGDTVCTCCCNKVKQQTGAAICCGC